MSEFGFIKLTVQRNHKTSYTSNVKLYIRIIVIDGDVNVTISILCGTRTNINFPSCFLTILPPPRVHWESVVLG